MKFNKKNVLILIFFLVIIIIAFILINNFINKSKFNNTSKGISQIQQNQFPEIKVKELTIQEKLALFVSEKEILNQIKNSGTYLEEIPRIETYYNKNAFYEFYLLLSVKSNDILKCDNIKENKEKELCKSLFISQSDKKKFIDVFKKYGESEDFAENMFQIYFSIKMGNCNSTDIITFLGCEKIFNKDINIKDIFIKYSILEHSNLSITKKYYKDLSKFWGFDNSFDYFVENTLVK